ncbi:hypothetical protein [Phytohabitans houttuyneae]|uniref:Uncharacterized protein n=1 Tax=Phytohabitans houttuyneae TaxID=1076126 RepID=A0A6V8K251_9ACTN|nr:hypothetical protein [Phytohabitans houttuyneae]GFJ77774.1 hypothetical protein Phou_019540 [Phytohabitans houttuyneae]
MTLNLPIDAEANELLQRSPLALLVGMILDHHTGERMFDAWAVSWYNGRTGVTWRV